MPSVSARIPVEDEEALEEVAELLDEDRSTVIRKALRKGLSDLRIRLAVQQYQTGEISTNQAARVAGVSVAAWLEMAREHDLTSQLSPEDLAADAETAREI
jgi:predicted HTH domain antitoxin